MIRTNLVSGIAIVILSLMFCEIANADFVPSDKPSFDVSTSGNRGHQNITVTGTLPIKPINGYVGIQYWFAGKFFDDDASSVLSEHVKARAEGGYHRGRFGLRGYARYGRESVMLQDSLFHSGTYLHLDIIKTDNLEVNGGIGTWIQREDLLPEYQDTETAFISGGPRAHLQGKWKKATLLVEFLPEHTFKDFTFRIVPIFEVPLFKVLFIEQIAAVVTGAIEYRSSTQHVDIAPWQWHWTHALRWKF